MFCVVRNFARRSELVKYVLETRPAKLDQTTILSRFLTDPRNKYVPYADEFTKTRCYVVGKNYSYGGVG